MTRYVLTAALALGGTAAFAPTADAQYVYQYGGVNPWTGGVVTQRTYVTPFASQAAYQYANPYTGVQVARYGYQNAWGTNVYRSTGFSPYYGGFNRGYYNPGFGASPFAGNYYRYRW